MVAFLVALLVGFATFLIQVIFAAIAAVAIYFFLQYLAVPAFLATSSSLFGGINPAILFFANISDLQFGLSVVSSAYVTRFVIRRFSIVF